MTYLASCITNGTCYSGYADGIWGEVIDYSHYGLYPQEQTNLVAILNAAKNNKFRYVIVRFGNYDGSSVNGVLDEAKYQMAWNFIVNTRNTVYNTIQGTPIKALFDLDAEGIGAGGKQAYIQRLWTDYSSSIGIDDTVGFSMIGSTWYLNSLSWYGSTKPKIYAFDIYGDGASGVGDVLVSMWNGLGSEKSKPIILMETFTNDPTTASQLQTSLQNNPGLNLEAIVQWPVTNTPVCNGCGSVQVRNSAVQALNSTNQISNYLSLSQRVVSDDTNSSLLHFSDVDCYGSTSGNCTIQAHIGYSPSGSLVTYQIYIRDFSNPNNRTLWICYSGNITANWPYSPHNSALYFEYYRTNSCSDSISGATPYTTSTIGIR